MVRSVLILCALLTLSACDPFRVSGWNTKMTVTVEVNGVEYESSGIVETRISDNLGFGGTNYHASFIGEAVIVDLGPSGQMFALWTGFAGRPSKQFDTYGIYLQGLERREGEESRDFQRRAIRHYARKGKQVAVPLEDLPNFILFRDNQDPATVEVIENPTDLDAFFRGDVQVVSITIERTSEARSEARIHNILPWICDFEDRFLTGNYPGSLTNHLPLRERVLKWKLIDGEVSCGIS